MDFDQLRTLLAVVEHGSFTRAAEALGLSQSTVSFHVKALESVAGTKLLDRGRDGVRPTASGELLRDYAQRLWTLRAEAMAQLGAQTDGQRGRVVVAASTIPGEYLLPEHLAALRGTHPGVHVRVDISNSAEATAAVVAEQCDLALVGKRPQDRRLLAEPFGEDEVVLVMRSGDDALAALSAPEDPMEWLGSVPLVLRAEGSGTRSAVAPLLAHPAFERSAAPRVTVGSTEAAKRCVLVGLGATFVSKHAVADELALDRLQVVPLPGLPITRRFWLVGRRDRTLSAAATALATRLRASAVDGVQATKTSPSQS